MSHKTILQAGFAIALLALLTAGVVSAQDKKQSGYTIYYLKHADANEVAKSLEMLLVPINATLNTPIVPAPRLNALFVNAPQETLTQVEHFLKLLDQDQETETTELKVFSLRNIPAQDAQEAVITFVGPSVRISSDPITNSLIIKGRAEDVLTIQALLQKLDEMRANENQFQVTSIELEHITPQKAIGILKELRTAASIAVDETRNRLLASGDTRDIEHLQTIIEMVDIPEEKTVGHAVQIRLVWLMEDKTDGEASEAPPSDTEIEKVSRVVEKRLGLWQLKKVAQHVVTVEPNAAGEPAQFTVRGSADLNDGVTADLEFEGVLTSGADGRPQLEIVVSANQRPEVIDTPGGGRMSSQPGRELASLNTKVSAPERHSVVLGVTSMHSTSSVFILQVLPADVNSATTE
jgi:hypothetical protein